MNDSPLNMTASGIVLPSGFEPVGAANTVPVSDGAGGIVWQQVGNAQVAAGAGIQYSKLNLTGQILNADLAGSIAVTKLVSGADGQVIANHGGAGGNVWKTPILGATGTCAGVALSNAFVDMTNMAVGVTTTAVTAIWFCIAHFQFSVTTAGTGGSRGQVLLDGGVVSTLAATSMDTAAGIAGDTVTCSGTVGPGAHIWKGQAKKQIAAGTVSCNGNSTITVIVIDL